MRRFSFPWLALITFSCATAENTGGGLGLGGNVGGDTGVSGSVGTAGTAGTDSATSGSGGSTPIGSAGSDPLGGSVGTGGVATSGSGGGIATGGGGTFGMLGGSGGSAGASGGASAGGGAGGNGGAGGKNNGGSGGTAGSAGANGGSAGKAGGGSGGTAGNSGVAKCGDNPIPARAQWVGSASAECAPTCTDPNGPYTAALAIDGNAATRFASGKAQSGDEWLQIDLGATATVGGISINTVPVNDYTRHYQVRVSATSVDKAAPILAEGDGAAGNVVIPLNKVVNGRYVLISQTGVLAAGQTSWWSINEIGVTCP